MPIETAPMAVLCLVAVVGPDGERRVFVSQTSHEGGSWRWISTVGWTGWGRMHGSWTPTHWMPMPPPSSNTKIIGAGMASDAAPS